MNTGTLTPERWCEVKRVFELAIERQGVERERVLAASCADDGEMRREVERMIIADEASQTFMEHPAVSLSALAHAKEENDAMNTIGRRIGVYKITREIGHGGMGAVYLAERDDDEYRKRVAIKLIKRGMDTDYVLRRFRLERQILAGLEHPNIARLLDGGVTEQGLPFFAMEYVEGISILDYADSNQLTLNQRLELFRTVCAAVAYAHQHLVVHRDLKPSNIIVTPDGTPKLLDFGIAKLLTNEGEPEAVTAIGLQVMTPEYASPEQVSGGSVTTATDVYSLGIILYQLLTGRHPFHFADHRPDHIAKIICETEPPRPSDSIAESRSQNATPKTESQKILPSAVLNSRRLLGDLDTIVLTAMRKEPANRYASVDKFSDDIRRYLAGLPVSARPATFSYRAEKFARRNAVGVVAACVILVTLVGGIVATTWQAHIANVNRKLAENRFGEVRRLANSFVFKYHDAIQNLPGATPVREMLVRDGLEYLDRLARDAGGDSSLQRELAAAYAKIGDVQGDPYTASLGDTAGAQISQRKALAIREALVAKDSGNADLRRELASSYFKIADIQWVMGDKKAALETYYQSQRINDEILRANPEDRLTRAALALNHISIADTLLDIGNLDEALVNYRQAFAHRLALSESNPADSKARRDLAVSHLKIGDALARQGELKTSLEDYDKAAAIATALVAAAPTDTAMNRLLANIYQRTGTVLTKNGEGQRALEVLNKQLAISRAQVAADPTNVVARRDLAGCYNQIGAALKETGDFEEATVQFYKAVAIFEQLAATDTKSAVARRDVMLIYQQLGSSQIHYDLAAAEASYRSALRFVNQMMNPSPAPARTRFYLAETHTLLAEALLKKGDAGGAFAECERALPVYEILVAEDVTNADYRRSLANALFIEAQAEMKFAANHQVERLRHARELLARSYATYTELRDKNTLGGAYRERPEEVEREIHKCDFALSRI